MGTYAYVARRRDGEEMTGVLPGGSLDEVVDRLHGLGLVVLHVSEHKSSTGTLPLAGRIGSSLRPRAGARELALFTRQLATVLAAGIPLARGLRGLGADAGSRTMSRAALDVALRLERGEGLADAMSAHPEAFNRMYVSMIRAGERSGTLEQILEDLASYLEKVDAIRTKVRSAMSYPVFVLVFALAASAFLLLKLVPTFVQIYGDLGQELPPLTRGVIMVSNLVREHSALAALVLGAVMLIGFLWSRTRRGRFALDLFVLRVPIFGPIIRKSVLGRFSRTFGVLLRTGLPLLDALELVRGASGNAVLARAIEDASARISEGAGITDAFRATGRFPEMSLQLMSTGEETGDLDALLIKASEFYDRQVEASVHSLTSLIEPVMVVLVGGLIGVVVVSMFLPIFNLGDAVIKGGYQF